ncbi:hypothetical protein BT69DRAFT_1336370 [Atractiella rhizophila]|nr:hypothetical protein BT69DRAFT_1336370 [Atractiella rhizophila]
MVNTATYLSSSRVEEGVPSGDALTYMTAMTSFVPPPIPQSSTQEIKRRVMPQRTCYYCNKRRVKCALPPGKQINDASALPSPSQPSLSVDPYVNVPIPIVASTSHAFANPTLETKSKRRTACDLCHNKKRKCHLPPGVQPNTGIACVTCAASKKKHKCSFEPEVTVSMHSVQQNQSAISDLVPLATATKKTSSGSSSKVIFDDATLDLIFGSIPPVNTTTATASDSITMLDTNNFSPSKAPDLDVSYLDTVESSPWPETSRASAASSTQTVGNETWEELLENFPVTQQEEDGK